MADQDQKHSPEQRDSFARWISGLGLAVAILSALAAFLSYSETVQVNARTAKLEAHVLLDDALDMMGGKAGTESFILPSEPPNEAQRRTLELARRKIERALTLAPDFYLGHEYFAVYLHISGNPQDALNHHRKAIQLNEDDGWPYADYANSLRELGQYSEAIEALEKALDLDPTNPDFHRNLGLVFYDQSEFDKAEVHFKIAETHATRQGKALPFPGPRPNNQPQRAGEDASR